MDLNPSLSLRTSERKVRQMKLKVKRDPTALPSLFIPTLPLNRTRPHVKCAVCMMIDNEVEAKH